jgi:hypothetical protein
MNPVEDFLGIKKESNWLGNLLEAFKGGFAQQALFPGPPLSMSHTLARGAGMVAPMAILGTGLALGREGIGKGIGAVREHFSNVKNYKKMLDANPTLHKEEADKVKLLYNSFRSLAPSLAKDPLVVGSFIRDHIKLAPDEGVSVGINTAKLLTEAERAISGNKRDSFMNSVSLSPLSGLGRPLEEKIGLLQRELDPHEEAILGSLHRNQER